MSMPAWTTDPKRLLALVDGTNSFEDFLMSKWDRSYSEEPTCPLARSGTLELSGPVEEAGAAVLAHMHPHASKPMWLFHAWTSALTADKYLTQLGLHAVREEAPRNPHVSHILAPEFLRHEETSKHAPSNVLLAMTEQLFIAALTHTFAPLVKSYPGFEVKEGIPLFMRHLIGAWNGNRVDIDVSTSRDNKLVSTVKIWEGFRREAIPGRLLGASRQELEVASPVGAQEFPLVAIAAFESAVPTFQKSFGSNLRF